MLYLRWSSYKASPKAVSRRTSYLRVRLEFLPYPHLITTLFNGCVFGPPTAFTQSSTWTWVDHPVSGLPIQTLFALFRLDFSSAPYLKVFNLACIGNSPDRSTKSTWFHLNVVPQLVNTGVQVLFHSPLGVLFTVPSQYSSLSVTEEYLALGGGPPDFPQGFSCLVVLRILPKSFQFHLRGFHPFLLAFPKPFGYLPNSLLAVHHPRIHVFWFRLFPVRSPLLRKSMFLSLPLAT